MGKDIKLMKRNPILFDSLELFTSISREKKLTLDNSDDIDLTYGQDNLIG